MLCKGLASYNKLGRSYRGYKSAVVGFLRAGIRGKRGETWIQSRLKLAEANDPVLV
jgi:hypothetical protein